MGSKALVLTLLTVCHLVCYMRVVVFGFWKGVPAVLPKEYMCFGLSPADSTSTRRGTLLADCCDCGADPKMFPRWFGHAPFPHTLLRATLYRADLIQVCPHTRLQGKKQELRRSDHMRKLDMCIFAVILHIHSFELYLTQNSIHIIGFT